MAAIVSDGHRRAVAFATAVMAVLALLVPFSAPAQATHPTGCTMEVLEEVDTNPSGTTHTLTAALFAGATGSPGSGVCEVHTAPIEIDFEVEEGPAIRACTPTPSSICSPGPGQPATGTASGSDDGNSPQQPDLTCSIPISGGTVAQTRCSVTFTTDSLGRNVIRGWVDHDGSDATVEADASEGRYAGPTDCTGVDSSPRSTNQVGGENGCATDAEAGPLTAQPGQAEPDITDVVEKTWTQSLAGPTCVDLDPNREINPSGTDHALTVSVTNQSSRTAAPSGDDASEDSCSGSGTAVRPNTEVRLEIVDDNPNAFFVSVNGQPTNGAAGSPNIVTCMTNSLGQCTAVIRTVNPSATGDNSITASVPGSTGGISQTETVLKEWVSPQTIVALDLIPEEDTNPVNTPHQLTARAINAAGEGLANALITFEVSSGVNQGRDFDGNPATPPGFIDQCTTGSDGSCSRSYTSTAIGTDTITACNDQNANFDCEGTEADSGNTRTGDANDDQGIKHWVSSNAGPSRIALDMEGCDGDLSNPSSTSWNASATPNGVSNDRKDAHAVCAAVFASSSNSLTRTQVTFSITSGPGTFVAPSTTSSQFTAGSSRDLGKIVTVDPGTCASGAGGTAPANAPTSGTGVGTGSYNCAFLLSNATGNTVVKACIEGTLTCASGTKPWQIAPSEARTVTVTPETATNLPGTNHELVAAVRDRFGNPVSGVAVNWTRTGVGTVVSQENVTDAAGEASFVITSDVVGETSVTADITNSSSPNQCAQPAGTPSGASAGDCSDTATKTWSEDLPECSDGDDNDSDGNTDFPDDPGCTDEQDTTESPDPFVPAGCRNRGSGENVIVGTSGADVLNGSPGRDVICGAGGDDIISGRGGGDLIQGNGGDDTAGGGGGKDNVSGNAGNDNVSGNRGNDAVRGNGGADTLKGNAGIDSVAGGSGNDSIQGGDGPDILKGGSGNDSLRGGAGDDQLSGGPGRDQCFGNAGRDRISGCE